MDVPVDAITDTTPVPLSQAIRLFFPLGGVTKSSLRNEARKGRLVIERIANKDFVTRQAINDMRRRCRVAREAPPVPATEPRRSPATASDDSASIRLRETIRRIKNGEPIAGEQKTVSAEIAVLRTRKG